MDQAYAGGPHDEPLNGGATPGDGFTSRLARCTRDTELTMSTCGWAPRRSAKPSLWIPARALRPSPALRAIIVARATTPTGTSSRPIRRPSRSSIATLPASEDGARAVVRRKSAASACHIRYVILLVVVTILSIRFYLLLCVTVVIHTAGCLITPIISYFSYFRMHRYINVPGST